jgi:hypothetical protein
MTRKLLASSLLLLTLLAGPLSPQKKSRACPTASPTSPASGKPPAPPTTTWNHTPRGRTRRPAPASWSATSSLPAGRAGTKKKNFANRAKDDPALKGWTLGVPRGIYYPEPFQIFQRQRDLTLVHQFGHSVRTIHTNGTPHPGGDRNQFWLGDSRGKWEGDTLVVDVADFNDETWLDRAGNYHSESFHVVERWKYLDANTIEYSARLEDPEVFSKPWDLSVILHRHRERISS